MWANGRMVSWLPRGSQEQPLASKWEPRLIQLRRRPPAAATGQTDPAEVMGRGHGCVFRRADVNPSPHDARETATPLLGPTFRIPTVVAKYFYKTILLI